MRTRRVVLLLGFLAVIGVGAFVVYRSSWVRSWFARDSENLDEMTRLRESPLKVAPAARGPDPYRLGREEARAPVAGRLLGRVFVV